LPEGDVETPLARLFAMRAETSPLLDATKTLPLGSSNTVGAFATSAYAEMTASFTV
jgi:hypothetical protein